MDTTQAPGAQPADPTETDARTEQALHDGWVRWRHEFHRFPETGFAEQRTAARVSGLLQALGWTVAEGIGGTGVVASLTVGTSPRTLGLRADMDALAMQEQAPGRAWASAHDGCMHACGHDGHMAMLLGAAELLARRRDFDGTVRLIFQPAEEHGRGAAAMLADGLLARFPIDEIYGAHNIPGLPTGHIATRVGGLMASEDNFRITVEGRGGHAARPQQTVDALLIGAEIVLALQTVVARSVDPRAAAVVSCTRFHTDGIRNAIAGRAVIEGDTRSDDPAVQALLERRIREIAAGIGAAHGARCTVDYTHDFAPTVNDRDCTAWAVRAAQAVAGAAAVEADTPPMMISEDFGRFLQVVPGAFVFIGNGDGGGPGSVPLHNPGYDFNDAIVPLGARWFAELARLRLPAGGLAGG
jgi:hippurate hydrolase